jgi:TonB family protein
MNTRDQFGHYLLLKKVTEDALGETFRAGRIGRQALDRVALLRVYNGQGLDSDRIAKTIQGRGALAQVLKSPNIAAAVDSGQVRGVPYVAYDYLSGRTLAQLSEQAVRRGQPVALDLALLIVERIASGLAVAYETRFGDDRVIHGMLTPHQVLVSHDGELRLSGFEAAPGLRSAAPHPVIKQTLGRYLAPEALAGQAPAKTDDVFSVGAILFELLTGQPTPAMPASGLAATIEQAVVAADGGNLHPDLAALLKRSLCPADQRVGDIVAWHKTLAKLMSDGQYNPTTFNLAFFLHNLFRDEIERETQELETEKTQAISIQVPEPPAAAAPTVVAAPGALPTPATPAPPPTAAPVLSMPVAEVGGVRENTDVLREKYGLPGKKAGSKMPWIAIGAVALIVVAVAGYLIFGLGSGSSGTAPAPAPADQAAAPAPAPQPAAGPSPEEIQAQIAKMVAEQSKELEAGLKAQYDEKLKDLQRQLEESKQPQAPPVRAVPAAAVPAPRPSEPAPTPAEAAPQTRTAGATAAPTTGAPAPATATPTTRPAPAAAQPAPAEAKPAVQETKPAPPEPKPSEPQVRVGDLVTFGPGVVPPRVTRQPPLRYPPIAQRMRKEATVTVSVLVDENGHVVDVRETSAKAGFGLDQAAADYARECAWAPATKDGVRVRMWYDLKVAFTLGPHG